MGLISSGIEKVMVYELPRGIWSDGDSIAAPRVCLVKWRSRLSGKFYQVYVNGQFAGATLDSEQRQMIVQVPASLGTAVRIEVFAVEAADVHIDFSDEIGATATGSGRVRISLLRAQDLPTGGSIEIYGDNGTGQINYDNPLTGLPIRLWPAWQDKAGFGMSRFGSGDFGYDSAAAAGFGKGSFGHGQFGLDADAIEWVSPVMKAGVYKFAVRVIDEAGNESSSQTGQVTVTSTARPAEKLSISSFDKQTNELLLSIS